MLLQIALFHSFLWPSSIPLYICTTSSLSPHLSMDIYVAFISWALAPGPTFPLNHDRVLSSHPALQQCLAQPPVTVVYLTQLQPLVNYFSLFKPQLGRHRLSDSTSALPTTWLGDILSAFWSTMGHSICICLPPPASPTIFSLQELRVCCQWTVFPPKRYIEVWTPRICECDLIWK